MIAPTQRLKVLSLFCGCGGLDAGFHANRRFSVEIAIDAMPHAVETYNANHRPAVARVMDVRQLVKSSGDAIDFAPDVIVGGPPCQDYSSAGKQHIGERASLTTVFCDIVVRYEPRYFVMENVPNIKSVGKRVYDEVVQRFRDAGYGLTIQVIRMDQYGVPQSRKRLIILGERGGKDRGFDAALERAKDPVTSMRQYMSRTGLDLGLQGKQYVYRHPRSYQRRGVFSIDELHPTVRGCRRNMPPGYRFHAGDKSRSRDAIANPTDRSIALVQTFGPDFKLSERRGSALIIGNAVPPLFSKVLATIIGNRHCQQGKKLEA